VVVPPPPYTQKRGETTVHHELLQSVSVQSVSRGMSCNTSGALATKTRPFVNQTGPL